MKTGAALFTKQKPQIHVQIHKTLLGKRLMCQAGERCGNIGFSVSHAYTVLLHIKASGRCKYSQPTPYYKIINSGFNLGVLTDICLISFDFLPN